MKLYPIALAAALIALPHGADAQLANKGEPIEITADRTLEWHRDQQQYVANQNAVAKQGLTSIHADTLTADYRADEKSNNDIYRITAEGHVVIENQGDTVVGDHAVYMVDTGLATMTGEHLEMKSPTDTVTCKDRFEYYDHEGKIKAIGDAKLVHGVDVLTADVLTAYLTAPNQGQRKLDHAEADGHVKIVTPTDTLTGKHGTYAAGTALAVVTGDVRIVRDKNVMTGQRAETDLNTNISRMFGSSIEDGQTGGRVHGIFFPSQKGQTAAAGPVFNSAGGAASGQATEKPAESGPVVPVITTAPAPGAPSQASAPPSAPTETAAPKTAPESSIWTPGTDPAPSGPTAAQPADAEPAETSAPSTGAGSKAP